MKTRIGFVSNSSSSSFVLLGALVTLDEAVQIFGGKSIEDDDRINFINDKEGSKGRPDVVILDENVYVGKMLMYGVEEKDPAELNYATALNSSEVKTVVDFTKKPAKLYAGNSSN